MKARPTGTVCPALALVLLIGITSPAVGQVIGALEDPEHLGIDAYVDILSAQIEQDRGLLTFTIETRGEIPTTLPAPEDSITYLWFVDADDDPNTGQFHGDFGSDFNVRAVVSETQGGGWVDVCGNLPGGGGGEVTIAGNLIRITVGLPQIANPEHFPWRCSTFQMRNGTYAPGNPFTVIDTATPAPYTSPARVAITTPLLMLIPEVSGQLEIEVRDTAGALLPTEDYHLICQSDNEAVATVDEYGLVTAHPTAFEHGETAYVTVSADGIPSGNTAVIRVTGTDLGVSHEMYDGIDVGLYLPPQIEGVDLDQITTDYQVASVMNLAYTAQQTAMGTTPFRGGKQYIVLDVTDNPATVPCGMSGNPVRLGWLYGNPSYNCYLVGLPGEGVPRWGVMFHEIGHNFNWVSLSFGQFVSVDWTSGFCYSEGLATLCGMWSHRSLMTCGPGLGQIAHDSIDADYTDSDIYQRQCLANYQLAGAEYADLTPDVLDGILWEMYDAYGVKAWFDLLSTFTPPEEPLPYPLAGEVQQATWFVAALSASAGIDLRATFVADYGFPIDNAAWPDILAAVQARIDARPWQPPIVCDLDCDGDVDLSDLAAVLGVYGACEGEPNYNPYADFDDSGCVELSDLAELLGHYGT